MKNATLKTLLLSTALTIVATSASFAEGWNGFRIGAGGGGNFATTELDSYGEGASEDGTDYVDLYIDTLSEYHPDSFTRDNPNEDGSYEPLVDLGEAGAFGTVELGADFQSSSLVMGLTANYDMGKTELQHYSFADSNAGTDDNDPDTSGSSEAILTTDLELGNSWAIGGRIGFLPTDSTLIFASGGYQRTKATLANSFDGESSVSGDDGDNDANGDYSDDWLIDSSETKWLNGYYVGGGVETLLTENLSLKMEYRLTQLDALTSWAETDEADYDEYVTSTVDPTLHSVRATIGIRF